VASHSARTPISGAYVRTRQTLRSRTNWVISALSLHSSQVRAQAGLNYAGGHNYLYEIYVSKAIKTAPVRNRNINQSDISGKSTSAAHPYLIRPAGLGQISHPFDTMVVTLFEHLQEPHDQPRSGKHKYLKIDIYRWSSPDLTGRCAGKLCNPIKCQLLSPLDSRDPAPALFTAGK
jgi:hypothetical protein